MSPYPPRCSPPRATRHPVRGQLPCRNLDDFRAFAAKHDGVRFVDLTFAESGPLRLCHRSQKDIARYLLNYMGRDRRYTEKVRNCQAFAADFFSFAAGEAAGAWGEGGQAHALLRAACSWLLAVLGIQPGGEGGRLVGEGRDCLEMAHPSLRHPAHDRQKGRRGLLELPSALVHVPLAPLPLCPQPLELARAPALSAGLSLARRVAQTTLRSSTTRCRRRWRYSTPPLPRRHADDRRQAGLAAAQQFICIALALVIYLAEQRRCVSFI